jgi:chemotaxis protein methyltransferase CheR
MGSDSESLGLPKGTDALLRALIHERTGVFFDNGRAELLTDKLSPLVIERGFTSFLDYYYLLKYDETAQDEWRNVMNALSVPETYFWREIDQVRALVEVILPRWVNAYGREPLKIWSAACATGEEPLTIALALEEAGWFARATIEIYASDASSSAIEKARRGVYRERSFRNLSPELRARYFTREGAPSLWRIREDLHARVRWGVANLIDEREVAPLAAAHVIFCRNVFIYFSESSIAKTVQSFARYIRPPGYLFVGTSESLLRLTTDFILEEINNAFVYVRQPGADSDALAQPLALKES